jgi:hypothetical protein
VIQSSSAASATFGVINVNKPKKAKAKKNFFIIKVLWFAEQQAVFYTH